jgi:acyl-CoA thioesterase-1
VSEENDTQATPEGRQPYGVGPAYPSRHTEFTPSDADTAAGVPFRSSGGSSRSPGSQGSSRSSAASAASAGSAAPGSAGSGAPGRGGEQPSFAPSRDLIVADGVRDVGLVFVGASLTAGYGDPKGLGWVGRVVARTQHPDLDLTAYNLGVRGNTSGDVVARWGSEAHPRWQGRGERRLVVSVGAADLSSGMTMARSRLNLANVIDEATSSGIGVFVVGLTPTLDAEANRRIEALAEAQADVCARRGVTYVDCFKPLVSHDQWMADLAASPDRSHPGQAGYGLVAWLVLHNGWNDWLGIS